jgi:hypothetical protein
MDAKPVKVCATSGMGSLVLIALQVYTDATTIFPFLVSEGFIPELERRKASGLQLRTQ